MHVVAQAPPRLMPRRVASEHWTVVRGPEAGTALAAPRVRDPDTQEAE